MTTVNALTIDVEDWFHILDLKNGVSVADYGKMESRVVQNTERLLRILHDFHVRGTFFVLGWVGEHYPDLVAEIYRQGHEIASHGYGHLLCYEMSREGFYEDTKKSVDILEEIIGDKIYGYRVAGYSIKKANLWALDVLLDLGLSYDSSIYPGVRGHGGFPGAPRFPYQQSTPRGRKIFEFPASCLHVLGKPIGFAGGGYLRLFPYQVIRSGIRLYNRSGHPANVFLHPREVDPSQPRLKMPPYRKFKSYINLATTETKLKRMLRDFHFGRIVDIFNLN